MHFFLVINLAQFAMSEKGQIFNFQLILFVTSKAGLALKLFLYLQIKKKIKIWKFVHTERFTYLDKLNLTSLNSTSITSLNEYFVSYSPHQYDVIKYQKRKWTFFRSEEVPFNVTSLNSRFVGPFLVQVDSSVCGRPNVNFMNILHARNFGAKKLQSQR